VTAAYHAAVRRAVLLLSLTAACGREGAELDGTWVSERDATAEVTIDGERAISRIGDLSTVYRQEVERRGDRYLLFWTDAKGDELQVEARRDGDRLLLAYGGQEFTLRRK
jgi:hypothetical protein